ncbi:MAG: tRNA (adenosine(37)-N6)-threonylcarbamoyltransferase complex dimerization subunit type 1 TsaB [Gammaproteobacteria bacterium]
MNILALDTSTEACSAALAMSGSISERFEFAPRAHSLLILPMLDALLLDAGITLAAIDAIAFGCGPGSFTGLRIAAGIAQGVAFGADLPVVPVSSLAALAQGASAKTGAQKILAAIDARMGEIYWGAYQCAENGLVQLQACEGVHAPGQVPLPEGKAWLGAGSGWETYGAILQLRLSNLLTGYESDYYPHAGDVACLAEEYFKQGLAVTAEQAVPVYLRNEVAWKKMDKATPG